MDRFGRIALKQVQKINNKVVRMKQRMIIKNNLPDWLTAGNVLELIEDWYTSNILISAGQFYLYCTSELVKTKCYFTVMEILDQEIHVVIDGIL